MKVRTLKQARTFVLRVQICGIFSNPADGVPCLWDVVDLPDRRPGEVVAQAVQTKDGGAALCHRLLSYRALGDARTAATERPPSREGRPTD